MIRLSQEAFDEIAGRAIEGIPEELRGYLENVMISVQKEPSPELLEEMGMDPEEDTLLGLYQGVALTDRSATEPPLFPDTIFLFQDPIEEICDSIEEIEEEIAITVVHEIAHHFGIDEDRLAELGYD
jgi:predicted Zn-dependent protease with MMP-like domain